MSDINIDYNFSTLPLSVFEHIAFESDSYGELYGAWFEYHEKLSKLTDGFSNLDEVPFDLLCPLNFDGISLLAQLFIERLILELDNYISKQEVHND